MDLAEYLATNRETNAHFAARIERSEGTISRIKRHIHDPDAETARAIVEATNGAVDFNDLFGYRAMPLTGRSSRQGTSNKGRWQHGLSKTRLYQCYKNMIGRCYDDRTNGFNNYGGRGIRVCSEWLGDIIAFFDWAMAHGYRPDLTLDRINVDGDYAPSNCRWATAKEQARNKRQRANHAQV